MVLTMIYRAQSVNIDAFINKDARHAIEPQAGGLRTKGLQKLQAHVDQPGI